jgi:hypothetical protein
MPVTREGASRWRRALVAALVVHGCVLALLNLLLIELLGRRAVAARGTGR